MVFFLYSNPSSFNIKRDHSFNQKGQVGDKYQECQ